MSDPALAWRIEETCFNAFPSLKQAIVRGWLLRFAEGVSRRANSANPLCADRAPVGDVIDSVEMFYRRHALPAIVRVPSFLAAEIEEPLVARGYRPEGESCVLYGAIDRVAAAADAAVELSPHAGGTWLAGMAALQRHNEAQRSTYRRIVRAVAVPCAFAALRVDGRIAALAVGALSNGMLCYESVITDPRHRRRSLARRVVAALAAWAAEQGAHGVCLQVEAANVPARALYDGFGMTTEAY